MRKERTIRDLAAEFRRPAAGNLIGALWTAALRSQAVVFDQVSIAADYRLAALRAMGVLGFANLAGKISGIDVAESSFAPDFCGAQQVFRRRVALALHLVVGVKGGDVPRDVGGNSGYEFSEAAEFVVVVVETGNEKCDDLQPKPHGVNVANAVENGADAAAEFVIVAIVETLEIDLVEIEMGAQEIEDLRRAVAVRNESGDEAGGFGFFENGDGPFAGDERLVVGADQNFCALIKGVADQRFGRRGDGGRDGIRIAQGLRGDPVLAVGAMEIAAQHAEAVGQRAGIGVEERFLFDGIALHAGGVSPGNIQCAAAVEADFADAGLTIGDGAAVAAREAANAVAAEMLVKFGIGFTDALIHDVAQGGHGDLLAPFYGMG